MTKSSRWGIPEDKPFEYRDQLQLKTGGPALIYECDDPEDPDYVICDRGRPDRPEQRLQRDELRHYKVEGFITIRTRP